MVKFTARYFDGRTTRPLDAVVEVFPEAGLKITFQENEIQREIYWPKNNLQVMERYHNQKPAVIGCKTMLGARLIVDNQANYENILPLISKRNIKLSHIHHPWRVFWIVIALCLLILFLPILQGHQFSILLAKLLPYSWETMLWENLVKPQYAGKEECIAPKGKTALDKLVAKLSAHAKSTHPFDIRMMSAPNIVNAESLPGFHIILYSGILHMGNPDDLAAVLAHEMAHSVEHHATAGFIYRMGMDKYLGYVFGLSHKNMAFDFINLKYGRDYENKADDMAISLLKQAHISPKGFERAMKYLEQQMGRDFEGLEPYLVDHPKYQERIDKVKANEDLPNAKLSLTTQEWQDLKSICDKTKPMEFK